MKQRVARLEDVANRSKPGKLPFLTLIGVERVEMARAGKIRSWECQREVRVCLEHAESKQTGAAVSPGAAAIARSPA